ncbi:MAG TPA: hypothetical protein VK999_08180 [Methylotenera sp.]|nr:hypothetical protein [Methylotenera sp.]
MKHQQTSHQQGIALVSILWILLLLMLMTSIYLLQIRMEGKLIKAHQKKVQASSLAQSGIWIGLAQLLQNPRVFSSDRLTLDGGSLVIEAYDEAHKTDLNAASENAIEQSLLGSGLDPQQASIVTAQILDWRDFDDKQHVNGMEDKDYHAAGFNYASKDGPFNASSELILLPVVNSTIYDLIKPTFTVYSQQGDISAALLSQPPQAGRVFTLVSRAEQVSSKAKVEAVIVINPDDTRLYQILSWRESGSFN